MDTSTPEEFVERDCKIQYAGRTFTANGAYVLGDRALVYVKCGTVTDWRGKVLGVVIENHRGTKRFGKWGPWRMSYVRVLMNGREWWGRYNADNQECVRLRAVKRGPHNP